MRAWTRLIDNLVLGVCGAGLRAAVWLLRRFRRR